MVDPTTGNAPYDIKAANGPFPNPPASLAVEVAYTTQPDFTNTGSNPARRRPVRRPSRSASTSRPTGWPTPHRGRLYRKATAAMPVDAEGSGASFLEGRTIVDVSGEARPSSPRRPVGRRRSRSRTRRRSRRAIVDIAKCDDCHQKLSFHGDNRNDNTELCATCHNPNATANAGSRVRTVSGRSDGQSIDFKLMIHAIHAATYDFGSAGMTSLRGVPGQDQQLRRLPPAGHVLPGEIRPTVFATSITRGANAASPVDDIAYTPNAAICSSCHTTSTATLHIEQNGGSFSATKNADGTSNEAAAETCASCHGPGRPADVKVEHGVGLFPYN